MLQRRLLAAASDLLAPGGCLVYSTCTTNERENEEQLRFAEEELGLEREILKPFPGFTFEERPGGAGALMVNGDKSEAQGFFLAQLRKTAAHAEPGAGLGLRCAGMTARHSLKSPRSKVQGQVLSPELLEGDCCDPARLPHGRAVSYGGQVRFIPSKSAAFLPPDFVWQGMPLGRMTAGRFRLAPRLRFLLPRPAGRGKSLVLDDVRDVAALLHGQSRRTGFSGHEAGLWWRDLPLCLVRLKLGRASAAF
jgi:16S rRNA (cytosine1407-C5)-methyltransferase